MKPSSDIESTGCSITGGNPVRYSARFFVIFGLQISGLDFDEVYKGLKIDRTGWGVEPVKTFTPGTRAGLCNLEEFCAKRIKEYGAKRNDPNVSALSNLSPWVNNGQVKL